jgi:hypothetical protein
VSGISVEVPSSFGHRRHSWLRSPTKLLFLIFLLFLSHHIRYKTVRRLHVQAEGSEMIGVADKECSPLLATMLNMAGINATAEFIWPRI